MILKQSICILGARTGGSDDKYHWHDCDEAACPITDNSEKEGYAEHTWQDRSDADKHWQECSVCGKKRDEGVHSYGDWQTIKEATAAEAGSRERVCSVCGYKETEPIPKIVTPAKPTVENKAPETGDDSLTWVWAALLRQADCLFPFFGSGEENTVNFNP